jgi:hypothetical protein
MESCIPKSTLVYQMLKISAEEQENLGEVDRIKAGDEPWKKAGQQRDKVWEKKAVETVTAQVGQLPLYLME